MGGAYHALFVEVGVAAVVSVVAFLGALAVTGSRDTADGSVVASRLRDCLPNLGAVIASAAAWYTLAETVEPAHAAASPVFAIAALAASAWLVLRLAFAVASAISAAVFAIFDLAFAPRLPVRQRRKQSRPLARRPLFVRRHLARPPPILATSRA